jgi:hypothetical protein
MPSVFEQWIDEADARVAEIGPIALSFQAEDKLIGLPTVAELSAEDASRPIAAAVSEVCYENEIHTIAALRPAAVGAKSRSSRRSELALGTFETCRQTLKRPALRGRITLRHYDLLAGGDDHDNGIFYRGLAENVSNRHRDRHRLPQWTGRHG